MNDNRNEILIIAFSPELFWYLNTITQNLNISTHHISDTINILNEINVRLPQIIILDGSDATVSIKAISKFLKNHLFLRKTTIIVFCKETSLDQKREYLICGATYIFTWPSKDIFEKNHLKNILLSLIQKKAINDFPLSEKWIQADNLCRIISWGRIGILGIFNVYFESNVCLQVHDEINFQNELFSELKIKNPILQIKEKNKSGRYYNYLNSYNSILMTNKLGRDQRRIEQWLKENFSKSKRKDIKVIFIESNPEICTSIYEILKNVTTFSTRGYLGPENLNEILEEQLPILIIINSIILNHLKKIELDTLLKYTSTHNSYVISYNTSSTNLSNNNKIKYNHSFLHIENMISLDFLTKIVAKLIANIISTSTDSEFIHYFSKDSNYSRIGISINAKIKSISTFHLVIESNTAISENSMIELYSSFFTHFGLGPIQFVRIVSCNQHINYFEIYATFIGFSFGELRSINSFIDHN